MYVEARKRTTTWWLGRVAIAFTVVLATALMLLGVSRGAAMSSMPVSEAGSNPVAPIASIATITGTAISTPVPPPGCEIGWEPVTHPGGGLLGVTALNASEAWIGGTGRVLSWNGARWAATPLPTQIPNVILERDSASTGNNVWGRSSAGAVRWDGANWNLIPYPTPTPPPPPYTNRYDFASIGAASPYDVWLTGGYYDDNDGDHPAVIFHWNGVQWNLIPFVSGEEGNTASPSTPEHPAGGYATYSSVGSVAIAGRDEMWAISSTSPPPWANYPSYSIMHVTPAGARYVPSPYPQGAYHSIAVAGPNDVWVFGRVQGSTGSSLILHWDGSTFTEVAHPGVGSFTGSEAIAPNNVWAATADGDFLHWDGSTWSVESVHTANTWRLAASGPYDVWAVGISAQATPVLLHYPDLPTFTDVPLDNTFYANIRCLACRGIVSGYADGTFRPNNDVTRGQLAKIVSSAAGFTESPDPQIFEDVAVSYTHLTLPTICSV